MTRQHNRAKRSFLAFRLAGKQNHSLMARKRGKQRHPKNPSSFPFVVSCPFPFFQRKPCFVSCSFPVLFPPVFLEPIPLQWPVSPSLTRFLCLDRAHADLKDHRHNCPQAFQVPSNEPGSGFVHLVPSDRGKRTSFPREFRSFGFMSPPRSRLRNEAWSRVARSAREPF
jgi:hypothetical protein